MLTSSQMLKEAPAPTEAQLAAINKFEEDAKECLRRVEESWERSDTDGFLSQWANDITARLDRQKIEILKNGGYAQFPVLCDEEGNVICYKIYTFQDKFSYSYNRFWKVDKEKYGRRWIPIGKKSRIQKQLKLHEETRWMPAYAYIGGSGTGLSGCANAFVTYGIKED
jgi:hypothetical protein